MRACALVLLTAVVACGGAATLSSPAPSATAETATIAPAGTVTATAITGTIVPGTLPPNPTPTPSPTPSPAAGGLTQAQLKYRVVDQFGRLLFCDPDYYPVARADEQALAHERLADIQKDAPTFSAILAHLGFAPAASYTKDQELAIYRDWKMLNALRLEQVSGGFHFTAIFSGSTSASPPPATQGSRVDGTIDQKGAITVVSRTPSGQPPCPICLARGTRIATPSGYIAVEDLKVGDVVWTIGEGGARVALPLVEIGSTPVTASHRIVQLRLSDGRAVDASPGHPTADGRKVRDLAAGDSYDGAVVVSALLVPYVGSATFDLLPAGATGTYWANGVLLGSTLRESIR
jgi:Hint domain-containing protein